SSCSRWCTSGSGSTAASGAGSPASTSTTSATWWSRCSRSPGPSRWPCGASRASRNAGARRTAILRGMADVAMPRLSDSMEEGTILKWLKSDGDEVSKGEELVEIETDKANMTYEADQDGTLEIVAQEGDTLPVGETICKLGEGGGGSSGEAEDEADEREAQAP